MMAEALPLTAASTAAMASASVLITGGIALLVKSANNCLCQIAASASLQMLAIVLTHSSGYSPLAVSPELTNSLIIE